MEEAYLKVMERARSTWASGSRNTLIPLLLLFGTKDAL